MAHAGSPTGTRPTSSIVSNMSPTRRVQDSSIEEDVIHETTALLSTKAPVVYEDGLSISGSGDDDARSQNGGTNNPQILLIPFLLYCTAMGAVAVPKLNVILGLMCTQYEHPAHSTKLESGDICNSAPIQKRVGHFMMCAHLISGICCMFSSQRIGAMSDRYGRKPLLAYTAIGLLFGDVMSILASWFPHRISVYWVLSEFAIGGLSGTFSATMAIIQAFVVDCAEESSRVTIFSRYHAAMFLGVAIGPITGELFVRTLGRGDMLSVFYAAACCHGLFICFALFGIRESVPRSERFKVRDSTTSPVHACAVQADGADRGFVNRIVKPFHVLYASSEVEGCSTVRNVPFLAAIDGIVFGIQVGFPAALLLYADYNFGWRSLQANLFVSLTNSVRALVLVAVLPLVLYWINRHTMRRVACGDLSITQASSRSGRFNVRIIRTALLADVASHVGFALAGSTLSVMLWGIPAAAGAVISPIAQSLMSSSVGRERIGELFGTVSLIHALSRSVMPAGMQLIWSSTVDGLSGAVFLVLACTYGLAFLLALRLHS